MVAMSKIPGYVTVQEIATALEVSHSQAARYVRTKKFKRVLKVGNQSLIPRAELERFEKPLPGNPNWRRRKNRSA